METKHPNFGTLRKSKYGPIRTNVGPRVFIAFIVLVVVTAALGYSANTRLEERERVHPDSPNDWPRP
jgi:hypothetical protein